MIPLKKRFLLIILVVVAGLTSCSTDDDDEIIPIDDSDDNPTEQPVGSFTLPNQPLIESEIHVEDLVMPEDGWVVVRRDNGDDAPDLSEIISIPKYEAAGNYPEITIQLLENLKLEEGEKLWVNLHADNGDQVFSYNGSNDIDIPLGYFDVLRGFILIAHSFIVDLPNPTGTVLVEDQVLEQDGQLVIKTAENSNPGWLVIYTDRNGQPLLGERISVPLYIEPGSHSELEVELKDNIELDDNEVLWAVLHLDNGNQIFEFVDGDESAPDKPITDDNDEIVKDAFMISFAWPTGSLTVEDQFIDENRAVIISSIEMGNDGWVVLHKDFNEAPLSLEIISEPLFLKAGTYENVELHLKEDIEIAFGEKMWAGLYSDNGNNIYEYDGTGEVDEPFLRTDGTPVVEDFIVYDASSIGFFWLLTHPNADLAAIPLFEYEPGWIAVYRDDGSGAPDFTEIVSIPQFITGDSFALINFKTEEEVSDQEILWIALHSDDGDGVFHPYFTDMWTAIDHVAKDEFGRKIMQAFRLGDLTFL